MFCFVPDGFAPPARIPRVLSPPPPEGAFVLNVKSAVSTPFPVDANIVVSMEFDMLGAYPPHHAIVFRFDMQPLFALAEDKSPKSAELPKVDNVAKLIVFMSVGVSPPANNARVPRPVFDPVPQPNSGSINSN